MELVLFRSSRKMELFRNQVTITALHYITGFCDMNLPIKVLNGILCLLAPPTDGGWCSDMSSYCILRPQNFPFLHVKLVNKAQTLIFDTQCISGEKSLDFSLCFLCSGVIFHPMDPLLPYICIRNQPQENQHFRLKWLLEERKGEKTWLHSLLLWKRPRLGGG